MLYLLIWCHDYNIINRNTILRQADQICDFDWIFKVTQLLNW